MIHSVRGGGSADAAVFLQLRELTGLIIPILVRVRSHLRYSTIIQGFRKFSCVRSCVTGLGNSVLLQQSTQAPGTTL